MLQVQASTHFLYLLIKLVGASEGQDPRLDRPAVSLKIHNLKYRHIPFLLEEFGNIYYCCFGLHAMFCINSEREQAGGDQYTVRPAVSDWICGSV